MPITAGRRIRATSPGIRQHPVLTDPAIRPTVPEAMVTATATITAITADTTVTATATVMEAAVATAIVAVTAIVIATEAIAILLQVPAVPAVPAATAILPLAQTVIAQDPMGTVPDRMAIAATAEVILQAETD